MGHNHSSKLKQKVNCPICGVDFHSKQTYEELNRHIDSCLESQNAAPKNKKKN